MVPVDHLRSWILDSLPDNVHSWIFHKMSHPESLCCLILNSYTNPIYKHNYLCGNWPEMFCHLNIGLVNTIYNMSGHPSGAQYSTWKWAQWTPSTVLYNLPKIQGTNTLRLLSLSFSQTKSIHLTEWAHGMASEASGRVGKGMVFCSSASGAELWPLFSGIGWLAGLLVPSSLVQLMLISQTWITFSFSPLGQVTRNYSGSIHHHINPQRQ